MRRHFTWPGTLRLHRAALGADILRAPVNVLMAPVLLLARLSAWTSHRLRLHAAADWLNHRRFLLRTAVAAQVERAVLTELLDVPLVHGEDPEALRHAILAAPRLREAIRRRGSVGGAQEMAEGIMRAVSEYTGTRSAMAEFTTALVTLTVGALAFHTLTPGMISMAPGVAEAVSRGAAIADFPLGSRLGSIWYGVFPAGPAPWLLTATIAGLVLLGSIVAAFAGTVADPVQARLGIHRRRLMRLLDAVDAEIWGTDPRPFVAREHLLVRLFDLWDAALSMLRVFRGRSRFREPCDGPPLLRRGDHAPMGIVQRVTSEQDGGGHDTKRRVNRNRNCDPRPRGQRRNLPKPASLVPVLGGFRGRGVRRPSIRLCLIGPMTSRNIP